MKTVFIRICQTFLVVALHFAAFSPCSLNALELDSDGAVFEKHQDNRLANLL